MNIYESNLKALFSVNEELANKLKKIQTNKIYEVFVTDMQNLSDLRIIDNRDKSIIDNTTEDIEKKLNKFEKFDNYHSLYFFGIGSGIFYYHLLKNITHKKIYIFEPELELLYIILNLIDFTEAIIQKRLIITYTEKITFFEMEQVISKESKFYLKVYNLDIYSIYYDKYMSKIKHINEIILRILKNFIEYKGNSLDDTLDGYIHSANKMLDMFTHPSLDKVLKSVHKKKHAVLVSTGPSLQKQLPLLKKYQDYFTILSVDASFPVLCNAGIKPDIVLAMERVPQVANFFKDIPKHFFKDVVFMLATVCHEDAFNSVQNGIVCPYLRPDTHNVNLGLDEWGYLGAGMCGANYLLTFSMHAKFENFVFIGQDLAFSKEGKSHTSGHVFGVEGDKYDDMFDGYITAYGGDGEVATQKYWKLFLNDFEIQIEQTRQFLDMQIYNATEGGARIPSAVEIPFKEYCENILDTNVKKNKLHLEYPSNEEIKQVQQKYIKLQQENLKLAKSIKKQAKKSFDLVEQFLKKVQNYDNEKLIKNIRTKDIDELLNKIYIVKDKYNNPKFINTFNSLFVSYLEYIEFDIAAASTKRENTPEAIKLKKINYIKIHYEWLYRLWGSLEKIIEITENSLLLKEK